MNRVIKNNKRNEVKNKRLAWVCISVIVLITYVVFSPSLQNNFTNWDDNVYVLENPLVVNDHVSIKEIFTTPVSANYHPITMLSFAWNYQKGKLDPKIYHRDNLILHLLNTLLVFVFIWMLTRGNLSIAGMVSLFFGIHPMHVESVAWISGRKDMLYVFFFLAGLIAYCRYRECKKTSWHVFTFFLFLFSCLSKAMAVVFPVILLLVDYLQDDKLKWKKFIEKIPFFICSIVLGIAAIKIQSGEAITDMQFFTPLQRMLFASYGTIMYVVKLVVPVNLSAHYPYPILNKNEALPYFYYVTPFILIGIIALVYFFFRKQKEVVFGLLFYLISILMVLQLISVGTAIMADRYTYLSYIGLLYAAAFGIHHIWTKSKGVFSYLLIGIILITATAFSYQTYARTQVWKNSEMLWTDVINKSGNSTQADKAYVNRGRYYRSIGDNNKALSDYTHAMQLNPSYAFAYNNRGNILREMGQNDSALADYNIAITLESDNYLFYANRANVYSNKGEYEKAIKDFSTSISLNPNYWANYYNRGIYYFDIKNDDKAIADFNMGIKLKYDYADLYYRRGMSYVRIHKYEESIIDFSKAIELNPSEPNYWLYRSFSNNALGRKNEANADLKKGKALLDLKRE